ncbi:MAG: glycosyltransferase N-terminal domain-containing protein [Chitinophagales bacterium]
MKSLNKRFKSSLLLYNIVLYVYFIAIRIAALFNSKAQQWIAGRKNLLQKIQQEFDQTQRIENGKHKKIIWLHAASLGEFEQGRPIMEAIKRQYPDCLLVLTFFSPSGYNIRKNYTVADYVYYLPLDSRRNAQQFIEAIQPDIVVFVKYEFWYYYFEVLHQRNIPIFIISAIFRPQQHFFKWYGSLFRALLQYCEHIFVQNEESLQLLQKIGIHKVSIAGDTRLDRVFDHSESISTIPIIEAFKGNHVLWVAGSTWPKDEEILADFLHKSESIHRSPSAVRRLIIAPHEIGEKHLQQIENLFKDKSIRYSSCDEQTDFQDVQVLIIDNIGLLSGIYIYGEYVYIGGGFGAGIHNTMEAAVFGRPIFFGPNYRKFQEAIDLIEVGAAYPIEGVEDFILKVAKLEQNKTLYKNAAEASRQYVLRNKGGSEVILKKLDIYLTK